jgi:hypothetical protein
MRTAPTARFRVVYECGMQAAFFWRETTDKGIVRYRTAEHRVHPGESS